MVGITQEKQIISFISIVILKEQNLGTIRINSFNSAKSLDEDQPILTLFENINIKHYNIMGRKKTNLRLTENITVQVPNTASISKDTLFHLSKFIEKIIFLL